MVSKDERETARIPLTYAVRVGSWAGSGVSKRPITARRSLARGLARVSEGLDAINALRCLRQAPRSRRSLRSAPQLRCALRVTAPPRLRRRAGYPGCAPNFWLGWVPEPPPGSSQTRSYGQPANASCTTGQGGLAPCRGGAPRQQAQSVLLPPRCLGFSPRGGALGWTRSTKVASN